MLFTCLELVITQNPQLSPTWFYCYSAVMPSKLESELVLQQGGTLQDAPVHRRRPRHRRLIDPDHEARVPGWTDSDGHDPEVQDAEEERPVPGDQGTVPERERGLQKTTFCSLLGFKTKQTSHLRAIKHVSGPENESPDGGGDHGRSRQNQHLISLLTLTSLKT